MSNLTNAAGGGDEVVTEGKSIKQFCKAYHIGPTTAYREINDGRLIVNKIGNRSIILRENELAWRNSLLRLAPKGGK
jgi:hypothetical protein